MSEKKHDSPSGTVVAADAAAAQSAPQFAANPAKIKALIFDMGHVFVRFDWERVCQGFCEHAKFPRDDFTSVLLELRSLGYERGHCDTVQFLNKVNELLGSNISVEHFTVLWNATFEEDSEMADLLQQLGQRFPVYLLSNTNENHYDYLQNKFNVARHFKELVLSYKVRLAKPDLEIYHHAVQLTGLQAGECVFVDDLIENIEAARQAGLHTIQSVGIADLKARLLSEFGVQL